MNIAGRTMRKAALSLGRGGSATPLAAPKMAFVRLQNSEIRASKWKKAGKTANSGDFRNDRRGVPLQNGFSAKTVGLVGGRARAVSKRSTTVSQRFSMVSICCTIVSLCFTIPGGSAEFGRKTRIVTQKRPKTAVRVCGRAPSNARRGATACARRGRASLGDRPIAPAAACRPWPNRRKAPVPRACTLP